jgi:hypothetical protein
MGRTHSTQSEDDKFIENFGWNPDGKRPLGRPRCRLEDNVRTDLRETGWEGVDWINLAQDRYQRRALVNTVIKFRVP